MRWYTVIFVTAWLTMALGHSIQAKVVELDCAWGSPDLPVTRPTFTSTFDYELQVLTILETIHEQNPALWDAGWVGFDGRVDSDTTFTIVADITNDTGITWTGFELQSTSNIIWGGTFVSGSAASTKLQTINYAYSGIQFSGPPPVLNGDSLRIQFDFFVEHKWDGFFGNALDLNPIPEPGTAMLFGFGGLALLRKRTFAERNGKNDASLIHQARSKKL